MGTTTGQGKPRIYTMSFASVYPHYVTKAEKKGRTKDEVDQVIRWLTGYTQRRLDSQLAKETDFETFTYSKFRIALFDIQTRGVRVLPLLGNVRHTNAPFGPCGELSVLADAGAFSDVYGTEVGGR